MNTITDPVTVQFVHKKGNSSITKERTDLIEDGIGANWDRFMKQLMELAGYKGKMESFELEHRNNDGIWVNLSKAELDRLAKGGVKLITLRTKSSWTWTLIVGAAVIVGLAAGYLIATRTSSAEKTVPVPPTSAAVPKPERSFSVNVKY